MLFLLPLSGFVVALIAQRVFVPLLVRMIGEKHFASPNAFDGCTLGIAGAVVMLIAPIFLIWLHLSPWRGLAIVFLGVSLYGLVWLWVLGRGGAKREWKIENGALFHRDGRVLEPTFVLERSDYFQTDAFNGYSHYFLELHDEKSILASNAFTVKTEHDNDLQRLLIVKPTLLRLDLQLVSRVETLWWAVAGFSEEWTPLLCGSLEKLDEKDRQWWRQWLAPQFPNNSKIFIDAAQWKERLESLRVAYPNFWREMAERAVKEKKMLSQFVDDEHWTWHYQLRYFDIVLSQDAPVLALTNRLFDDSAKTAMGPRGGTMLYNFEDRIGFVKLQPRDSKPT